MSDKKKVFTFVAVLSIFILLAASLAFAADPAPATTGTTGTSSSAAADNAAAVAKGVTAGVLKATGDFLKPFFDNKELITRFFFIVLLFLIISPIIEVVFGAANKWVNRGIAAIITLLAILWLPSNFITAIRDQYGVMGAAILSVIPFIILLIFTVRTGSILVGRLLWLFYVVYYFALYIYRVAQLYTTSGTFSLFATQAIPYIGAIIVGILMLIFLSPIRKFIFKGEMEKIKEAGTEVVERGKLLHKLQKKELEAYGS
jgi:hypothetical protein